MGGGNPFAFNKIPYGQLLSAVYLLGISTGQGGATSGMGLWGSLALLTRLGGKLKIGVTPRTGGLYESMFLPMDLTVSAQEVAQVSQAVWLSDYR